MGFHNLQTGLPVDIPVRLIRPKDILYRPPILYGRYDYPDAIATSGTAIFGKTLGAEGSPLVGVYLG
jgi:hypothetical protein